MNLLKKYGYYIAWGVIFFCAIFLRVYRLAQIPDILQLDEAGLSYNAWCLVHYGTDRYLNIHPFYAQNFEGGQSPLYTYLLVLLIKTLGQGNISLWLTRLPAVLASILLFLTGVKTISCIFHDRKFHIVAACFLAFCPYYIMSGRLALDCNLMLCCSAVSLLLLLKYIQTDKLRFLILCGISFGFTMYSYALSYFIVPIFLVLVTLYMLYTHKITFPKAVLFAIIVCVTATPVILFACSLLFQWEPIHFLGFIISPIASERMSDIGSSGFWKNLTDIIKITLTHSFYAQDAVDKFYTLYPISIPFIILGFFYSTYEFINSIPMKSFHISSMFLFFYISGLITIGFAGTQYVYRANSFFICYLYFWINGLVLTYNFLSKYHKPFIAVLICSYFLWTASFINYYFNIYTITDHYPSSLYNIPIKDAVDYAESHANFLTLYMDCTGMSEFYFFYYPVDPSTITSEEHYQNGSHGYEFWVDYYATPVESSNAYIVRKENWEFINKLNDSGLSFQTVEYPHYYLFYFE